MTSTDNISLSATSKANNTSLTDDLQKGSQETTTWKGRETVQVDIEIQPSSNSTQVSTVNKIDNTASTNLLAQTELHKDASFNPFIDMQVDLLPGFKGLQNTLLSIVQNINIGLSKFVNVIKHDSETAPKIELNDELTRIKSLPVTIQDIIDGYIDDPTETIYGIVKNGGEIPDYLKHHARHVTHLDLGSKSLDNQQLLNFLSCFKNLETLVLPFQLPTKLSLENELKHSVINTIVNLKRLSSLDLHTWVFSTDQLSFITDEMIERIVSNKNLRFLNISHCTNITVKGFRHIATCQELEHLNLSHCKIDDECLSEIVKITSLKVLHIDYNPKITISGFAKLKELVNLNSLFVMCILDEALNVIGELQHLSTLSLVFCHSITNHGLKSIMNLSNLSVLSLMNCYQIGDDGLLNLSNLTKLKMLDLQGCVEISENGLSNLESLKDLEYLDISSSRSINSNSLKYLYKYKKLKELVVDCYSCSNEDYALLKEQLPNLEIKRQPIAEDF